MRSILPRVVVGTCLLLFAIAARGASVASAVSAYSKGDRASAYREFLSLARIGNGVAQLNVGVMLLNGEGVPRDVREGFYWLMCAQDNGVADARPLVAQIESQVKPEAAAKARQCIDRHGRAAALAAVPRLVPFDDWSQHRPPARLGKMRVLFPWKAEFESILGWVDTEITVGVDGRVHDVWIVDAVRGRGFEKAVLDGVRETKYEPALLAGKPVPVLLTLRWNFGYQGVDARDGYRIDATIKSRADEAAAGKAESQYLLYRYGDAFPELRGRFDWRGLGLSAIDASHPGAMFHGGYCPITARGECIVVDRVAGLEMVRRVAVLGDTTAQVALGRLSLAEGTEDGTERARRWLEAANLDGDPWASRYLAAALLASSDRARRDGPRATALLAPLLLDPWMEDDPATWELAAAASAESGRAAPAVAAQDRAIAKARRLGWDLGPLMARRAAYARGEPPSGPVLVLSGRMSRPDITLSPGETDVCREMPAAGSRVVAGCAR